MRRSIGTFGSSYGSFLPFLFRSRNSPDAGLTGERAVWSIHLCIGLTCSVRSATRACCARSLGVHAAPAMMRTATTAARNLISLLIEPCEKSAAGAKFHREFHVARRLRAAHFDRCRTVD